MEILGEGPHTSECINWRGLLVLAATKGKDSWWSLPSLQASQNIWWEDGEIDIECKILLRIETDGCPNLLCHRDFTGESWTTEVLQLSCDLFGKETLQVTKKWQEAVLL